MTNNLSKHKFVIKAVFVDLGTPSIFKRHLKDFDENLSSFWSVGFEPTTEIFSYPDKEVSLQVWNLRLSPDFSEVRNLYMQNSFGLVICFHQNDRESFTQVPSFLQDFKKGNKRNFPNFSSSQLLLLNLLSSQEGDELVSTDEAQILASSLGMSYHEMQIADEIKFHEILSTFVENILK